jgi:N utilization substance protein B
MALLALYQLDAMGGEQPETARASLDALDTLADEGLSFDGDPVEFTDAERDKAFALARGAWEARAAADAEFLALAPEWPAGRQAAVDRAILRLAHHEMTAALAPPKAAVNEAVELAKAFSTDKSPSFINGLLSRVLKRVAGEAAAGPATPEG